MIVVVLRVSGENFDVDSFLKKNGDLEPDSVWRRGESRAGGRIHEESGFNKTLGEGSNKHVVLSKTEELFDKLSPILNDIKRLRGKAQLDFGMMIGGVDSFTLSLNFKKSFMENLVKQDMELCVSAYPIDDECE